MTSLEKKIVSEVKQIICVIGSDGCFRNTGLWSFETFANYFEPVVWSMYQTAQVSFTYMFENFNGSPLEADLYEPMNHCLWFLRGLRWKFINLKTFLMTY